MRIIGYITGLIGMWVLSDGIYSWALYKNAPGYAGSRKQTFKRDHWIRAVRLLCGFILMVIGSRDRKP